MKKFFALSVLLAAQAAMAASPSMVLDSVNDTARGAIARIQDGRVIVLQATPTQDQNVLVTEFECRPGIVEKLTDCIPETKKQFSIGIGELKEALISALRSERSLLMFNEKDSGLLKLYRESPFGDQEPRIIDDLRIAVENKSKLEAFIEFAKRNGGSAADVETENNNLKRIDSRISLLQAALEKSAPEWSAVREVNARVSAFVDNLLNKETLLVMPNSRDSKTLEYQMARDLLFNSCEVVVASGDAHEGQTCTFPVARSGYERKFERAEYGYMKRTYFGLSSEWVKSGLLAWSWGAGFEMLDVESLPKIKEADATNVHSVYTAACKELGLEPISRGLLLEYRNMFDVLFGPGKRMICVAKSL